jgi:hypothetical protein
MRSKNEECQTVVNSLFYFVIHFQGFGIASTVLFQVSSDSHIEHNFSTKMRSVLSELMESFRFFPFPFFDLVQDN